MHFEISSIFFFHFVEVYPPMENNRSVHPSLLCIHFPITVNLCFNFANKAIYYIYILTFFHISVACNQLTLISGGTCTDVLFCCFLFSSPVISDELSDPRTSRQSLFLHLVTPLPPPPPTSLSLPFLRGTHSTTAETAAVKDEPEPSPPEPFEFESDKEE